jgi:hypothetical protein
MLLPLLVVGILLLASLLVYGAAIHLIVRVLVRLIRKTRGVLGFWESTAVTGMVMLIAAAAHLTQIVLWAATFLLCGQVSTVGTAFYFSALNYTALGSDDIRLSERWRLLGPLEAMNGAVFFGLSTAVLFGVMSHLIAHRLRSETGYPGEAAGDQAAVPVAGDARPR